MAVADAIPTILSARILRRLQHDYVFAARTNRSYQGELSEDGKTVKVFKVNDITSQNYDPDGNTDITYTSATPDAGTTITVDQNKYWATKIEDVHRRDMTPNVLDEAARTGALGMVDVIDQYVRDQMEAGSPNQITLGTEAAPTDAQALVSDGDDGKLIAIFAAVARHMTEEKVPAAGRWAIIGPYVHEALGRILSNTATGSPESVAGEILRGGYVGNLFGLDIYSTGNADVVKKKNSETPPEDIVVENIQFGNDYGYAFIELIARAERIRLEGRFADGIRGEYYYGGDFIEKTGFVKGVVTLGNVNNVVAAS